MGKSVPKLSQFLSNRHINETTNAANSPHASTDLIQVSTNDVRAHNKVSFWTDLVRHQFMPADIQSLADPAQFHGRIQMRRIAAVNLAQVSSTAQQVSRTPQLIAQADCEYFLVNIQRKGTGGVLQDGRLATLKPGDLSIYSSTRRYDLLFDAPFLQTVLMLPASQLRQKIPGIDALTATTLGKQNAAVRLFTNVVGNYFRGDFGALPITATAHAADALTTLLAATAAAFLPTATLSASNLSLFHLTRIKRYAAENIHDPALSVSTVSQALCISPAHIHRLFEGERQTFSAWLRSCRLMSCKLALESETQTHRTISEIAFQYGFNDSAHFSRIFRKEFGCTPRECRGPAQQQQRRYPEQFGLR